LTSAATARYFWVIPVVPVASAAVGVIAAVLLIAWLIRRYIRRALALEQQRLGINDLPTVSADTDTGAGYSLGLLTEPLREGVIDLRTLANGGMSFTGDSPATPSQIRTSERMTIAVLLRKYRLFLLFIVVVAGIAFFGYRYLRSSFTSEQHFKITDVRIGQENVSK
jgi:multidrug efflux pump subunit AcrB